ncbi:MAG: hypothetical protein JNN01_11965 [Opitutaceae bacterium]|nr:hypothetical protein [Opitutaceae bacterium]
MIPVTATVPVAATAPAAIEPATTFSESDLARLRELIQSAASQTANPQGLTPLADGVGAVDGVKRSFGDSILEGMMRFGNNYQSSLRAIETRLQDVVKSEGTGLTNFSEILALQIDVSKWSMSVMGVDNAAKAGANTVKELSRGG